MTHRSYGRITPYWKIQVRYVFDWIDHYRGWIYIAVMVAFMLIFWVIGLMKSDAERNLQMVNQIENQKVEQIQFQQFLKDNR